MARIILLVSVLWISIVSVQNQAPYFAADFPVDTLYTMQGKTPLDSVIAIPVFNGIPELNKSPFIVDPNGDHVTVSAHSVDQAGSIEAFVQDGNLYLRATDPDYKGITQVLFRAEDPGGLYSEMILPVVVFGKDRTLEIDGKKRYFVPWSSQLDINRILSVEQFLRDEGYQEEALDRSINYSKWKMMKRMKDVQFVGSWWNEFVVDGWSWEAQKMLVDYYIDELAYDNCNHVWIRDFFFIRDINSTDVFHQHYIDDFNRLDPTGSISLREFEWRYIINQLHNKGMGVSIVPTQDDFNFPRASYAPVDWGAFFENFKNRIYFPLAKIAFETGVEVLHVGDSLINS